MDQFFFYNFSGRNLPDYSRTDFDTMLILNGMVIKTGYQLPFPAGPNVKAIDLKGAVVFPPFSDAHVHFTQTGISHLGCDLESARNLNDVFALIREEIVSEQLLLGFNLQEQSLSEGRLPTAEELDRISTDKIIWLARKDLHSAVMNSAGLTWAIDCMPDLQHQQGFVSGEYYNRLAYLLGNKIPDQMLIQGMQITAKKCLKKGVTFIHALEGSGSSKREAELAAGFFKNNQLDGVVYHQSHETSFAEEHKFPGFGGCLLVDGSFGTRTAALNQPYFDDQQNTGQLYMSSADIEDLLKKARYSKLQLALHAIGDRAIDLVASSYNWCRQKYRTQPLPDRIEHFILPSTKAIRATKSAEAMVCIQPAFDYYWGGPEGLYSKRLGSERAMKCNPFKTLLDLGIPLAAGSDSPVTPIDPLLGIHALVNHSNPEESLSLNSALSLYITEPHRFVGKEKTRGQLKTGYKGDFICLSEDPFLVPESRLRNIEVTRVFIDGVEIK
jgi:predicted amidohydrolase YtcJ